MSGNRGQTSLDFAVGMSTLLLVFAFVLTFVPSILSPFTASGQEETITADRVADHLAEGLLAKPGTPHVLDAGCTQAFFDPVNNDTNATNNTMPAGGCAFDPVEFRSRIAISQYTDSPTYRQRVNVTLVGNVSGTDDEAVLCWSGTDLVEKGDLNCATSYEIGPDPPTERSSVVATRRIVSLDGHGVTLEVRVW